jgi:hypothetical protein
VKIRTNFVGNSSSSSFLVIFPTKINTVEELKTWMFGASDKYIQDISHDDIQYSSKQICETVFKDIFQNGKASEEKILELFEDDWDTYDEIRLYLKEKYGTEYTFDIKDKEIQEKAREYERRLRKEIGLRRYKIFMQKVNETAQINIFEYSDNDGNYQATLEHGGIFDRLEHIRFNHH